MPTFQNDPIISRTSNPGEPGVLGESQQWNGVLGVTTADGHAGVAGVCDTGRSNGVYGRSKNANGVIGFSSAEGHSGVAGANDDGNGAGVYGRSKRAAGVHGESAGFNGVLGVTTADGHAGVAGVCDAGEGNGVYGRSKNREGVHGETQSTTHAAIAAFQLNPNSETAALYAKHAGNRTAAVFEGNVIVTGDITLANADCAEYFDISDAASVEPGTVMVLGDEGTLHQSQRAYDKRVAGVVSGAGNYKPGLVLDKQHSQPNRKPIALLGKIYCKVDASYAPIQVGDLLTTAPTPGHAMKATDPLKSFGAVIGKALRPLREGQGLIPILIALQ
jgi:hypothetical protein